MRIEGKTVVFKTDDRLFGVERSGRKPYTVRILEIEAFYALEVADIERVRIERAGYPNQFFVRDFFSVAMLGEMLGRVFAGIAWNPRFGWIK